MIKVNFTREMISVEVPEGTTILQAARTAGVLVESPCGGMGTCGKCKVRIRNSFIEEEALPAGKEDGIGDVVLACRTQVTNGVSVETLSDENQNKSLIILSEGESFAYRIDPSITKRFQGENTEVYYEGKLIGTEDGNTEKLGYGLSIDIGTTTLVCALIDLFTGDELGAVSELNPQSLHAQDVMSRIQIGSRADGLDQMYEGVTGSLNRMIEELCRTAGVERRYLYEAVYSGNTTMIHLALRTNPASLGQYPYTPVRLGGDSVKAGENNLSIADFGVIYTPPVISAFVGPDITSGILAARLQDVKETVLFIDIGTNGEMVLAKDGVVSAASTAAGPAFEGMNITFGMRAGNGAVEGFEIAEDGTVSLQVIGGDKAIGICGSGLFDVVAELVRTGVITESGRFADPGDLELPDKLKERLKEYQGKLAFEITPDIFLTLKDIRQVQLAKGAIRAGITALLRLQNVCEEEVSQVLIAGSFGYHLKAKSLVNITLIPERFQDKIRFVGNTSKAGGKAFLLNRSFSKEMNEMVKHIHCVELANVDGFEGLFVGSLNFTRG